MSFAIRAATNVATSVALCLIATVSTAASEDLDDVVVTANRVEQRTKDVIGSVTVINREEIERRQVQSVQDLLRGEAGIDITNQGGLGKLSSLLMRGANANQTLVIIDGQRVGSATAGLTSIEYLPIDQIERIEIVRGPRSSLYGSDAIGGVIQIFTRKSRGMNASVGVGSHQTTTGSAGFGIEDNGLRFSVSGSHLESDGINVCNDYSGCYTEGETDRDGFRSSAGTVKLGIALGAHADLELSSLFTRGYTEYDGDYANAFFPSPNQTRFSQSTPSARLSIKAGSLVDITALGGISTDRNQNFGASVPLSEFTTKKRNASLQTDWHLTSKQTITLGGDYLEDDIESDTAYDHTSRRNTAAFAQYLGQWSSRSVSASVRQDDNEQFGTHTTGAVGFKNWFSQYLALNVGWSQGFHAPTFNDLYYPADPFYASNPNLKPETSNSYELGLSGQAGWLDWSAQAYQNSVKQLIAIVTDENFFSIPVNVSEARIRGLELTARTQWQQFNAALTYTHLDPRSRSNDENRDHILARRARNAGRLDLGYDFGPVSLRTTLNVVSGRYDNLANTSRMGGYSTVDLGADWRIGDGWSLQAKLANVTDHSYETSRYFNQDGRNWLVTVRYQP